MPFSMRRTAAATALALGAFLRDAQFASCLQTLTTNKQDLSDRFLKYMQKHGRTYQPRSPEYQLRLGYFQHATAEVERLNARPNKLWKAGINSLSDRSKEEFNRLNGWRGGGRLGQADAMVPESRTFERLPQQDHVEIKPKVDWGKLPSLFIRDQESCGSCWAVTATTVLAANSELYGDNQTFSTEQVVNCVPNPNHCGGTGGCDGSTVELAMQYTMLMGLKSPSEYGAYTAADHPCKDEVDESMMQSLTTFSSNSMVHHALAGAPGRKNGLHGWEKLPSNKYQPLIEAVNRGPVAISIVAGNIQMYDYGIFDDCTDMMGNDDWIVNHAVTLIGYGKEGKDKYWLIQNSWGTLWGEEGRFRISRRSNEEKHCGMDVKPKDGVACDGEDQPVKVCGTCGILFDNVIPHFGASS